MTLKRLANRWDPAYGGPTDALHREPRWARSAHIIEVDDGHWEWVAEPTYLRNSALRDIGTLIDNGWDVRINAKERGILTVHIKEVTE